MEMFPKDGNAHLVGEHGRGESDNLEDVNFSVHALIDAVKTAGEAPGASLQSYRRPCSSWLRTTELQTPWSR
eukprot:361952-Chlamydomonas_euryale.AAC.2